MKFAYTLALNGDNPPYLWSRSGYPSTPQA
ncbi:Uncharacterised protein [Vibrio cholerae]|nr:Uncharacterised protein [Vibrio cholerae]